MAPTGKASDYGEASNETTLVPGALTCYRHFGLNANPDVWLTPMNRPTDSVYVDHPEDGVFHAVCRRPRLWGLMTGCDCVLCRSGRYGETHESPDRNCKCGFYAHYEPGTDFYEQTRWNVAGRPGISPYSVVDFLPVGIVMVRAVVEMTGNVVLGTKGVRGQKMTVRALAVDWEKYHDGTVRFLDSGAPFLRVTSPTVRGIRTEPEPGVEYMVTMRAKAAAAKYRAEYFDDPADMYKAYPQQDLSALGIDPDRAQADAEARERLRRREADEFVKHLQETLTQGTKEMERQGRIVADLLAGLKAGGKPPATAFERVMKAKQSRPAPPGSGIDRRHGRLR